MSVHITRSNATSLTVRCARLLSATLLIAIAGGLAAPDRAAAQIPDSALRLYVDVNMLTHVARKMNGQGPIGDASESSTYDHLGPTATMASSGGLAGVGLGYALSPHVVLDTYVGFDRLGFRVTSISRMEPSSDQPLMGQIEVRPSLELALLKTSRVVPYAKLGGSYAIRWLEGDRDTHRAVGPVLGAGAHVFASKVFSLDTGLAFRALFVDREGRRQLYAEQDMSGVKLREYALMLSVGGSLWL